MSRDKVLSNWAVKTMLGLENFQIFNFYKGMIGSFPNSHSLEYLINTQRNTWVCEREEGRREKGGKGRGVAEAYTTQPNRKAGSRVLYV